MNLLLTIAIAISMVVLLVASLLIVLAALLSITSTEPFRRLPEPEDHEPLDN
jgi:hypothetical protein